MLRQKLIMTDDLVNQSVNGRVGTQDYKVNMIRVIKRTSRRQLRIFALYTILIVSVIWYLVLKPIVTI